MGVLLDKNFAQRLAESLRKPDKINSGKKATSLFYDARPAEIATEWKEKGQGLWKASAFFLTDSGPDKKQKIEIIAPLERGRPTFNAGDRVLLVWRGRWEIVSKAALDAFVIDYIERKATFFPDDCLRGKMGSLKECYLVGSDFYEQDFQSLSDLLAAKISWDVAARDWAGKNLDGSEYPQDHKYRKVETPIIFETPARILTASEYSADDYRSYAYRNNQSYYPPVEGKAFFPFKILLGLGPSWTAWTSDRRASEKYYLSETDNTKIILDHPRRHFTNIDEVPDVFFNNKNRSQGELLYCPVCYVPNQSDLLRRVDGIVTKTNGEIVKFAPITRPFKYSIFDQIVPNQIWSVDAGQKIYSVGDKISVIAYDRSPIAIYQPIGESGGETLPTPQTPDATAKIVAAKIAVTWSSGVNCNKYEIVVYKNETFISAFLSISTSCVIPILESEAQTYRITICGLNVVGARGVVKDAVFV